jgi:PiT family inorganic phosphate transporter
MSAGISIDLNYSFEVVVSWVLSPAVAFLASAAIEHGALRLSRTAKDILALNRLWATLTLLAGFYASYTLGANTIGLLLGLFPEGHLEPLLLSLLCSSGAVAGIVFLSKGTARSVAENVVGLTPSTAMSAQFGGALSTHLFTQLGMPVSTSQVVVGGMTGAASVKRYSITNRRTLLEIVSGWTVGPLAGAAIAFLILEIM